MRGSKKEWEKEEKEWDKEEMRKSENKRKRKKVQDLKAKNI